MSLKQALNLLSEGQVLVMAYGRACRIFYNEEYKVDREASIFCYLDCSSWPLLMQEGEWDFYLLQQGSNKELKDGALARGIAAGQVTNAKHYVFSMGGYLEQESVSAYKEAEGDLSSSSEDDGEVPTL